jgi:Gti1/Pac2 family transcription factor
MRRWTDGKSWSASRVSGSFLTYREMEGKRGGGFPSSQKRPGSKELGKDTGSDVDMAEDGPDGYRYKPDGLMKQSFSITTQNGQHLHLISYYARSHPEAPELKQPSNDPHLKQIRPPKGMYPESTVIEQNIPPVTRAPMASSPFAPSPQQMPTAASPYNRPPVGQAAAPPPQPYGPHPAGYPWPPSPIPTPPQGQVHYSPYHQPSPHMMYVHQSPSHPSPVQYGYPGYSGPPHHQAPGPTAFDRPPAPLTHTGLPPPPQMQTGSLPLHMMPPGGPQHALNMSPRVGQAIEVAQQQQHHQGSEQPPRSDPSQLPTLAPPTSVQRPPSRSESPHDRRRSTGEKGEGAGLAAPAGGSEADSRAPSKIPSIHSLINGSTSEAPGAKSEGGTTSRAGSTSPGQGSSHDISHDKVGFGEDKRALRVLDKAMMRT